VPLYNNDDDFRLFCGMMDGLAFLPVPDLTISFKGLKVFLCYFILVLTPIFSQFVSNLGYGKVVD
jgi:hypothetical protein